MQIHPNIKKIFTVNFFIRNLLIPLALLWLFCYTFAFINSHYLIKGVNFHFSNRLSKYVLIVIGLVSLLVIFMRVSKKYGKLEADVYSEKVSLRHLPLLLLPLTPVVQYILNNQEILSLADVATILAFFTLFSSIYIFAIPSLMSKFSSTQILMSLGLAFVFTVINMPVLSQNFNWFGKGFLKIQLLYFGFVFALTWVMFTVNNHKFLYIILLIYFVSNSYLQFISNAKIAEDTTLPVLENELLSMTQRRSPDSTPNIYLLVYDSYVPNETMLAYGIDNIAQEKYLKDQGFVLYPHIYSIGGRTIDTMSRVLNASTEYGGDQRKAVSGDGVVQNTLRALGYKSYGLFPNDYMFRGIGSNYDLNLNYSSQKASELIISAALIGEFRWDMVLSQDIISTPGANLDSSKIEQDRYSIADRIINCR